MNSVYFNYYHDSKYPTASGYVAGVLVTGKNGVLNCYYGKGTGRTLEPGPFGITTA